MPKPTLSLRDATLADAPSLAAVQIAGWRAAYPGIVPPEFLAGMSLAEYTTRWEKILSSPGHTVVAVADTGVAAYCSFGPARDADIAAQPIGEIYALYVDPPRWRDGIGRQLCLRALELLCAAGCCAVTLWVAEANTRAQQFYRTLDFADDGGRKLETAGAPIRHLRFRWPQREELPFNDGARE